MLRLAAERKVLRVVADQCGCPTATLDIAAVILAVEAALAHGEDHAGTYHFAGTGATSWHDFAEAVIAAQAGYTGRRLALNAIATAE